MKYNPAASGADRLRTFKYLRLAAAVACLVFSVLAAKSEDRNQSAQVELAKRLAAASSARDSGDPAAVASANEHLIAFTLRLAGHLRLLESANEQAAELYKTSLAFEEHPDTYADLAISELGANRVSEAIADAEKALAQDPANLRAELVHARALMAKGEYAKAVGAYSQAVEAQPDIDSLYSLGICLLATGNPADKVRAATVFQRMTALAGETGSIHVLFGRAYRDAGDLPSAIRELEKAIQLDTTTPHAHYFLGIAHFALNEWKPTPEAEAEFRKEIQYHPNDFLANYMLGFLTSAERRYEEADRYLALATHLNGEWPEPWLYLGFNAYAQDDMKRAEEDMRKAVELTGPNEARGNYQIRRAYVDLGRILAASGRKDESEVFLTKARDLQNKIMRQTQAEVASMTTEAGGRMAATVDQPLSPPVAPPLAPLDKRQEEEQAPALRRSTDSVAEVDPSAMERAGLSSKEREAAMAEDKQLRQILGQSFADLATSEAIRKEYARALAHYQAAEHWDPNVPGLAKNMGQCAFRANDYAQAAHGLSRALAEDPQDRPVRAMLGMAYFYTQKYSDAATAFTPLGEAGMSDPLVGYAWAASLAKIGDLRSASTVLEKFQANTLSNDMLLQVGQLWREIGDYPRSVATLHRAIEADPSMPGAHYYAGLADILWAHWADAAAEFQAELAITPDDTEAEYNLGFVDLQQSRNDEALALFRKVIAADPRHANAQYQLGKMLLDRGQLQEAVPHLETAARLNPDKDYLHYQLQAAYRQQSRIAEADRELAVYKDLKARSRPQIAPSAVPAPSSPQNAASDGRTP